MKARVIKKQPPIALLYNIENNKSADIARIISSYDIASLETDATAAVYKVGYLCQYEGYTDEIVNCPIPHDEAIVFSACSGNDINRILADMKKQGITVELKGMVTDTNKNWGLGKLIEEFKEEKERLQK